MKVSATIKLFNFLRKIKNTDILSSITWPQNREIFLVYPFEDIKTIELEVTEGLNPKRIVYLCTKDERRIPLTPVQEPLELSLVEKQATNLAKFLDVNLSLK